MKLWQIAAIVAVSSSTAVLAQPAAPAPTATPASPVELVGDVRVIKVTVVNGQEKQELIEPKVVIPGDKLVFTTRYRNTGKLPVNDFVVTNPLPSAVMLSPEGAASHVVSVDGGKTWGALAALQVADAQGAKRPASASDVTHLRWTLPLLQSGASGVLTYNAIVR